MDSSLLTLPSILADGLPNTTEIEVESIEPIYTSLRTYQRQGIVLPKFVLNDRPVDEQALGEDVAKIISTYDLGRDIYDRYLQVPPTTIDIETALIEGYAVVTSIVSDGAESLVIIVGYDRESKKLIGHDDAMHDYDAILRSRVGCGLYATKPID